MKINQVKQFVQTNISRFEKVGKRYGRSFDLYDKNNVYRGEYNFIPLHSCGYSGIRTAMSSTRIMNETLKQEMSEIIYMNKNFVTLKDRNSDTLTKALPSEITITTTVLDFINDKFKTVRTVSRLKNKLQRLGNDDPDFIYSDNFVIYEPLKEKPQYEKSVEYTREGSISEIKKNTIINRDGYPINGSINHIPYRFW